MPRYCTISFSISESGRQLNFSSCHSGPGLWRNSGIMSYFFVRVRIWVAMWNIEGARCVLHQVTVLRKGIITKQHAWECLIRIKKTAIRETTLTELLRLDVLAIPFSHGQSDEHCMSLSLKPQRKRRVITWLYTVMMHKLHPTPSLESVDWRTALISKYGAIQGRSHLWANTSLGGWVSNKLHLLP